MMVNIDFNADEAEVYLTINGKRIFQLYGTSAKVALYGMVVLVVLFVVFVCVL